MSNKGQTPYEVMEELEKEAVAEIAQDLRAQDYRDAKEGNAIEPNHYTDMPISPLEFIEVNEDVLTWCTMNVIKYVGRHQRKNGLEDLKKAQWYLQHEIERLEKDIK